ncbi:putative MFS multidrug transporter [Mariannaea sp. PMI_226]|nr:putative MFS multidrug transporter [Mariannaea sp. PMI_226]
MAKELERERTSASSNSQRERLAAPPVYCALPESEKIGCIVIASLITLLGPLSGDIYLPALVSMSHELHVSPSTINLSITVFTIFQGIAPLMTASFSDVYGRRPILLACLTVYLAVNIGLSLQTNITTLFLLRCLQSIGSSGVSVVALGSMSDLITRAERGKYMVYTTIGFTLAPVIGPVIGGLLTQFLGWHSIFIFLAIIATLLVLLILAIMPETCRTIVGNGSILPPWWNQTFQQKLRLFSSHQCQPDTNSLLRLTRRPNLCDTFLIMRGRSTALVIVVSALLACSLIAILASLPSLFAALYGLDSLQIGLCYLPYACGGLVTRWTVGTLADRTFKQCSYQAGITVVCNQQSFDQLRELPLEKARLQLALPLLYASAVALVVFGWLLQACVHIAGPLVALFLLGLLLTGLQNTLNMLLIDLHAEKPATATAALIFFRALASAGAVAGALPLIEHVGMGWTSTAIAGVWLMASLGLWIVYIYGRQWRNLTPSRI